MKTVGVIGGGLMGMSIASRLSKEGFGITIFEGSANLGGLASAWNYGDYVWDKFYHVILPDDNYTLDMIKELGLEDELNWVETKTGFFINGQYHSMSNISEFLRFPTLNLIDKFRLGLTILAGSYLSNYERLEKIPVTAWLKRWAGKRTFNNIWLPLLKAKLGEGYKYTSAAFICATIKRLYGARKKKSKKEIFGYVNRGYSNILENYKEKLITENIEVITGYKVARVEKKSQDQIKVISGTGDERVFDYIICTLPSFLAASICPELSESEQSALKNIKYLGVACVSILVKKPLTPYYVTNITDPKIPFTGVIEMTALVDKLHFGGNSLIYLPKYLSSGDPMFEIPDEELKESFISYLKQMQPLLEDKDIIIKQVARAKYVITLPEMGYSKNLPSFKTSLNNLFIVNSSFITDGTLNVNETLKVSDKYLTMIINIIKQ